MKCDVARMVWGHPGGFIEGVRIHLPGVVERLEGQLGAFLNGTPDSFDIELKARVGGGPFRVEHALDGDQIANWTHEVVGDAAGQVMINRHLSAIAGEDIRVGNVCCKACAISRGPLDHDLWVRIQQVAVMIDPATL